MTGNGDPSGNAETRDIINAKIKIYTNEVRAQGLVPILDLVLNHVAIDSPLTNNIFSYFNNKKINTKNWFEQTVDVKWDDVKKFNYTDKNRNEIFEYLWKPLITRIIVDFGFDGARIDYATCVDQTILKMCIDLIRKLKSDAPIITFGESLIPGNLPRDKILDKYRDVGFTNLTNLAIFLTEKHLKEGKNAGYEWFLSDLGKKRWVTQDYPSIFRTGTIGFAGSHDHGTTLQAAIANTITKKEINEKNIDETNIPSEFSENTKLMTEIISGKIVLEKLSRMSLVQKESLAKERMAIAAFSSDAGWYLLAGDEILSTVTKRPLIQEKGDPFGGENNEKELLSQIDLNAPIPVFIRNINTLFKNGLRESEELIDDKERFYVEIFYLNEDKNGMCFVRHLNVNKERVADVVVVKLKPDFKIPSINELNSFLEQWSEIKQISEWKKNKKIKYFYIDDNSCGALLPEEVCNQDGWGKRSEIVKYFEKNVEEFSLRVKKYINKHEQIGGPREGEKGENAKEWVYFNDVYRFILNDIFPKGAFFSNTNSTEVFQGRQFTHSILPQNILDRDYFSLVHSGLKDKAIEDLQAAVMKHTQTPENMTGLSGPTNHCYANATMQFLFACPTLRKAILEYTGSDVFNKSMNVLFKAIDSSKGKVIEAFDKRGKANALEAIGLKTFYAYIGENASTHNDSVLKKLGINANQEDAHELLTELIDGLKHDVNIISNLLLEIEKKFQHSKESEDCIYKIKGEFQPILQVGLTDEKSDTDLQTLISAENPFEDNLTCGTCKSIVKKGIKLTHEITNYPKILIISLNRFKIEYQKRKKITRKVSFKKRMTLGGNAYNLRAVINHTGTAYGGHYTTTIKNDTDDKWYSCSDATVKEVTLTGLPTDDNVISSDSGKEYVFLYELEKTTD